MPNGHDACTHMHMAGQQLERERTDAAVFNAVLVGAARVAAVAGSAAVATVVLAGPGPAWRGCLVAHVHTTDRLARRRLAVSAHALRARGNVVCTPARC
jgi:hypothetical protein